MVLRSLLLLLVKRLLFAAPAPAEVIFTFFQRKGSEKSCVNTRHQIASEALMTSWQSSFRFAAPLGFSFLRCALLFRFVLNLRSIIVNEITLGGIEVRSVVKEKLKRKTQEGHQLVRMTSKQTDALATLALPQSVLLNSLSRKNRFENLHLPCVVSVGRWGYCCGS